MEILIQKVPTETGVLRKRILEEGLKEIQDFLSMEKEQHRSCFHFSFLLLRNSTYFGKTIIITHFTKLQRSYLGLFFLLHLDSQTSHPPKNTEHSKCLDTKPSQVAEAGVPFPAWGCSCLPAHS